MEFIKLCNSVIKVLMLFNKMVFKLFYVLDSSDCFFHVSGFRCVQKPLTGGEVEESLEDP